MSDRLKELQRQRALAQEQLTWFDREIARESGVIPSPVPTPAPQASAPARPSPSKAPSPADAERLIEQYQSSPGSLRSEVRRGCLLYFFAALALVALGLIAFHFIRQL